MCKVLIIEGHRLTKYFFKLLDWHRFTSLVTPCSAGKNSWKWEFLYWLGAHQRQFSYTVLVLYSYINRQKLNVGKTTHVYHLTASVGQESRHGSAGFSAQGLTRLQRCQSMLASHLKFGILFQAHVIIGRVHFLAAVDSLWLTSSRPTGEIL